MGIFTDIIVDNVPVFLGNIRFGDIPMDKPYSEMKDGQCPFMDQCRFLRENRTKMPELIARIMDTYCTKSACCRCARFRIAQSLGLHAVPPLMLPDQIDWARQIVQECGVNFEKDAQPAEIQ